MLAPRLVTEAMVGVILDLDSTFFDKALGESGIWTPKMCGRCVSDM